MRFSMFCRRRTLLPVLIALVLGMSTVRSIALAQCEDDGEWSGTDSLGTSHMAHTATLLDNGKVLIAGGVSWWAPSGRTRICELYDPTDDTWSDTGLLAVGRQNHTATRLANGRILIAGGLDSGSQHIPLCEVYDPPTEAWSETGSMYTGRGSHTATLLPDGTVLACGGIEGMGDIPTADATDTCEVYDSCNGVWTPTNSMSIERFGHTATLLNDGNVLVCGGFSDVYVAIETCELYDPSSGNWSSTGSLNVARGGFEVRNFTATLLGNGEVLVTGGHPGAGGEAIQSCELYDPVTGSWSLTADMSEGRINHSATLLENGKVLVAGGAGDPTWKASCELYDPDTETWCSVASLDTGRRLHTATLLGDGRVLSAGGNIGSGTITPSTELYESMEAPSDDSDGDGVPDEEDDCPDSDLSPTMVIDECDTGVENQLLEDGCTMADLIAQCADGAQNHGAFIRCVAHLSNLWKCQGLIGGGEKGHIQSCAAQADIP